jgi:hypothetical protein
MTRYDLAIIGGGVAGAFGAMNIASHSSKLKTVLFEYGPPPPNCLRQDPLNMKRRRRQLEGWFGCFPTGDGKLYFEEDFEKIKKKVHKTDEELKNSKKFVQDLFSEFNNTPFICTKIPNTNILDKIKEHNFDFIPHTYQQWFPDQIHALTRSFVEKIEKRVHLKFDTEVFSILKKDNVFRVLTSDGEYSCKNILLATGRSGWRWIQSLYKDFDILSDKKNNYSTYGFRIEVPASIMSDFNESHCSLKNKGLKIGPLNWYGTVIQEDHVNMTIAAFRSNEKRWETEKVSFSLRGRIKNPANGWQESARLAEISYVLAEQRVGKEKIKQFLKGSSQNSYIQEYDWMKDEIPVLDDIIPGLIDKGSFHVPDIEINHPSVEISTNFQTDLKGLFVAGENCGFRGISSAAFSGVLAAENFL